MARPLVLAHRGARRDAPENTLAAFSLALAQGADGVELDVHRTADGGLVVHHDADAKRLGVLATRTLAEIRDARPDIPTLDEVLDACTGALVNIEIKNLPGDGDFDPEEVAAELVVECLRRRGNDQVIVSSFNLATIDRVRTLDPSVPTALLIMRGIEPLVALDLCHERGHGALHPFTKLLKGEAANVVIGRANELDVRVHVWTVNDTKEMVRLADAGVHAVITDLPGAAARALS
ncbi:MAG: glycerophosphodiester phosphodiesterase [Actinobacteria bacterium]|nr:glycerophosphodiester phosphodiesterase [Actinomycetota bacterium]